MPRPLESSFHCLSFRKGDLNAALNDCLSPKLCGINALGLAFKDALIARPRLVLSHSLADGEGYGFTVLCFICICHFASLLRPLSLHDANRVKVIFCQNIYKVLTKF